MTNQLVTAAQLLREKVLAGHYNADEKLREVALAEDLSVSRTLVRLALGELEKDGLVSHSPNRGFRVRSITLDEVTDAILVRGELEAMAARLCAEQGISKKHRQHLESLLEQMDDLLQHGMNALEARTQWIDFNAEFHDVIISASENKVIATTIDGLARMPLVSSRALVFDQSDAEKSLGRIHIAHQDHKTVLSAILCRRGGQAEACMREHARKSAENKRNSFKAMKNTEFAPTLPGLALVKG